MLDLNLPDDLRAFLKAGRQLEYDPADCDAGRVVLLPLDQLKLELFGATIDNSTFDEGDPPRERYGTWADPHYGENGCYMVSGVNLVAECVGYEPAGLLLWLPLERRYATWDSSHLGIHVFPETTTWADIAADAPKYINAQWGSWTREQTLAPWPWHAYSKHDFYDPQPATLLNDPAFLADCVPLDQSRRALLGRAVRVAGEALERLGETAAPEEVGAATWGEVGRALVAAAGRIDVGELADLEELWNVLAVPAEEEDVGEAGPAVKEAFERVGAWLYRE